MLSSKPTISFGHLKPLHHPSPRTNAHLNSVNSWRRRNPEEERTRQGDHSCSCSATTQEANQLKSTTDPLLASQSKTLHGTLLIPHPLPNLDFRDPKQSFQIGFLMLTSEPGFNIDIPGSTGATLTAHQLSDIEFTNERWTLIEDFSKTALHRMLFRLCPLSILKSTFWTAVKFLPCRLWDDGRSEVAWDVMHALMNERTRACGRSFVRLLLQSYHRPKRPTKELMDTIKFMTAQLPHDYPKVTSKDGWNGVRSFIEHCVLMIPKQWPVVNLNMDPNETHRRLSGCRIQITYPTTSILSDQLHERTDTLLTEDMSIYPLPVSWLLSFLTLQSTLSDVVLWVNADRLRRVFEMDDQLSINSFIHDLQLVQSDNSKMAAMGNALLRFLTVMNRWQSSGGCSNNNYKAESVASHDEIRNALLGQRLMEIPTVSDIFLMWCPLRNDKGRIDISPLEIDWTPLLDATEVPYTFASDLRFFNLDISMGRNFKAMTARIYKQLGLAAVWDLCDRIGLVHLQSDSFIEPYIKGWSSHIVDRIQPWEIPHLHRHMSVLTTVFQDFCQKIGYEFQEKHRFDWAMHHPSIVVSKSAQYGWMMLIGNAIMYLFIQEYVTSHHPNVMQSEINGLFGDANKLGILFDTAFDLNLHEIGVQANSTVVRILSKSYKDKTIIRNDASTRNYMMSMMIQFVACLALDTGMDIAKTMDVIRPLFAKHIDSSISIGDTETYFSVERYVPTALEYRAAVASPLKPTAYYRTDVRLCKASGEVCYAVMVLTKRPLTSLSNFIIYEHRGDAHVHVQMTATDSILTIDPEKHDQFLQFQSDVFASILPPEMEQVPIGEQKKHYLMAPMATTTSDIDWSMIEHVTSGTLPSEITELVRYLRGDSTVDDNLRMDAAQAVLALDAPFQLEPNDVTDDDVYASAVRVLLFCSDLNDVKHLSGGSGSTGVVINQQCMLQSLRDSSTLSQKSSIVDVQSDRCLPFTLGWFTCLACLPFVFETMEQQLLTQDYHQTYHLPSSVSVDDCILALMSNNSAQIQGFNLLESVGHSVLQYLYTVYITTRYPKLPVGRQSVMRTQMFGSAIASKEATNTVMGHSLSKHFLPYKQGATWHPPGVKPFTLVPSHIEQNADEDAIDDESHSDDDMDDADVDELSHRVKSGFAQNFSDGIPIKHFKVFAALCFLREGSSVACDYLYRIKAVDLESYPSKPSAAFRGGPQKYQKLEDSIGYTFRDRRLLARVFMHSSAFPKIGMNNESLEFVGDAAADLIMWRYIHDTYPDIPMAQAAPLKMDLTSNDLFGWVSASPPLELPLLLMHKVESFDEAVQKFDGTSMTAFKDAGMGKIASDVFEALLGGILVDSGYSIDTVSRVMLPLIQEALDDPQRFGIEVPEQTM